MILSSAQRAVVKAQEHIFVSACPGAGKTRVVAAKVLREICSVVEASREIACISYTNAARSEILDRLEKALPQVYLEHVNVWTLHGFLLEVVLKPWAYLLPQFAKGVELATEGDPAFEEAITQASLTTGLHADKLRVSVKHYWRDRSGAPVGDNSKEVTCFIRELEKRARTDFAGAVFYAHTLLDLHEQVRKAIGFRFAWLLVDEYQDFNPTALGCFEGIAKSGSTKLFLIGDLGQLIFSFNGVDLAELENCVKAIEAKAETLSETYRCGPNISSAASRLSCGELQPIEPARSLVDSIYWQRGELPALLEDFLKLTAEMDIGFSETAIIATRWEPLVGAASILTGAGHRAVVPPDRDLAWWLLRLLTRACVLSRGEGFEGVAAFRSQLLESLTLLGMADRLWNAITDTGLLGFAFSARGQVQLGETLEQQAGILVPMILDLLTSEKILAEGDRRIFHTAARNEWRELKKRRPDVLQASCHELAEQLEPLNSIRCLTIHGAKGLEFDAVALISCGEGQLPYYNRYINGDVEEDRRKFFVAITRARRLFVALSDRKPSRFIGEAAIRRA